VAGLGHLTSGSMCCSSCKNKGQTRATLEPVCYLHTSTTSIVGLRQHLYTGAGRHCHASSHACSSGRPLDEQPICIAQSQPHSTHQDAALATNSSCKE
jgi:hypothetical protein